MQLVQSERLLWAWDGVIPLGVVTLLGGRAGIGKSTFLAWLTAQVTNGTLEGDLQGVPSHVTFVAGEDDLGRVLRPRLEAAGADLTRVSSISVKQQEDDGSHWVSMPNVKTDLAELKEALYESGTSLLIIDPLSATMEGDTNSEQIVRSQLGRLAHMAGEMNICVLAVKHWHKGQGDSIDRISGSHGFTDIVRSVLQLIPDEENDQLILSSDKNNYGQGKPSFAYKLETVGIPTDDGSTNAVGKAVFLGESDVNVEDILRRDAEGNLGDVNRRILDHLRVVGESGPEDISNALGVPAPTIRKYLSRLANSGHVEKPYRGIYKAVTPVTTVPSGSNNPQVTYETPHLGGL